MIDSNLTWNYHISYIISKISKTNGVIARLRHFVSSGTLLTLYRCFTRYLLCTIYIFYCLSFCFLPICLLYFKAVSILMHDVLNNISSRNISNLFNSVNIIHTYITRFSSADNIYTKHSRLTHQIKPFSRRGLMIWNSIPPDLRKLSKLCFKNKMRHILFRSNSQSGGGGLCHIYKKLYGPDCREYIIGLRYKI